MEFDMELSVPAAQGEVMDGYEVASLCCPQIRGTVGTKLQRHITVLAAQGRQGQSFHCVLKPRCYLSSPPHSAAVSAQAALGRLKLSFP